MFTFLIQICCSSFWRYIGNSLKDKKLSLVYVCAVCSHSCVVFILSICTFVNEESVLRKGSRCDYAMQNVNNKLIMMLNSIVFQ